MMALSTGITSPLLNDPRGSHCTSSNTHKTLAAGIWPLGLESPPPDILIPLLALWSDHWPHLPHSNKPSSFVSRFLSLLPLQSFFCLLVLRLAGRPFLLTQLPSFMPGHYLVLLCFVVLVTV